MVSQMYTIELKLHKAHSFDTEAPLVHNIMKQDDFNFEIVNLHFLMEIYLALLPVENAFTRITSNVSDLNNINQILTAKIRKQGYQCFKLRKTFSKFYHKHSESIVK